MKTSPLPLFIVVGPDQRMDVREQELNGPLGYFDPALGEIGIEVNNHSVGKHHILLHEMIHVAVEKLMQGGIIKRKPSEKFVTYLTGTLFPMLALSGFWNGVDPEEAREFAMAGEDDD